MSLSERISHVERLERECERLRASRDSLQVVCDDLRRQLRERDVVDVRSVERVRV